MSEPLRDDQLLRRLLFLAEPTVTATEPHLDEEIWSQWDAGLLAPQEHARWQQHLAECGDCRRIAALLLKSRNEMPSPNPSPMLADSRRGTRTIVLARNWRVVASIAAALLLAAGVWFQQAGGGRWQLAKVRREAQQMLAASEFRQTRELLADASRRGVSSDELLAIQAQAWRELPGEYALDVAGTLSDFGIEPGGIRARGEAPQHGLAEAERLLKEASNADRVVLLNRGHLKLSQGDDVGAERDFREVMTRWPEETRAQLGLGIALFLQDKFEAAEPKFQNVLRREPAHIPARINRALTLEELDRLKEACDEWRRLNSGSPLTEKQRRLVERALEQCGDQR